MEGGCLRGKAESALQTTALDEPCEYPVGRVTKRNGETEDAKCSPRSHDFQTILRAAGN